MISIEGESYNARLHAVHPEGANVVAITGEVQVSNLTSPGAPTHADVLASDERNRTADPRTGFDRSNNPAPAGTTHLFGARGPIDSTSVPTVPHTVDPKPRRAGRSASPK